MTDLSIDIDIESIEKRIISLAQENLVDGRPYYLSRLGLDLGEDLKKVKVAYRSLAEFIKTRLADEFTVVSIGERGNIQALVRSDASADSDLPPVNEVAASLSKPPRYHPRFWAAFASPIEEGKRRFLNLQDFTFIYADEAPVGDYVEIEPGLVPPADMGNRDAAILQNIAAWTAKHELVADRFLLKGVVHSGGRSTVTGRSVMEAIIGALDRRQLANVSLPLDVVADLMRTRI